MWSALGGFAITVAMIVFAEGLLRYDGWARANGRESALAGNRTYAVTLFRTIQLLAAGVAVFTAIAFFERI